MNDLISRKKAMDMRFSRGINDDGILFVPYREVYDHLESLPPEKAEGLDTLIKALEDEHRKLMELSQREIIYCKDCAKHNIGVGDFCEENGKKHWYWKDEACPIVAYRGKAIGNEFDYQFCVFGKRKVEK